jgi:hypothetical protein
MDREYLQHAVQDAVCFGTFVKTHAFAFATFGMITLYAFGAGSFIIAATTYYEFPWQSLLVNATVGIENEKL